LGSCSRLSVVTGVNDTRACCEFSCKFWRKRGVLSHLLREKGLFTLEYVA
jgi:hypothetical protein